MFAKAPGTTEAFVIGYRYDREFAEGEARFARDTFSYVEDCRKAGVQPNIHKLSVFAVGLLMPIAAPTPKWGLNNCLS